jgi:hypothetical protein
VRYAKNSGAESNFGNFKFEKNVNFGRNFLVDKDFKTKKSLDHKNAQKFGSKISRNLHKVPES